MAVAGAWGRDGGCHLLAERGVSVGRLAAGGKEEAALGFTGVDGKWTGFDQR